MSESSVYIILQTKKALELTKGVYVTGCRSDCYAASHHNNILLFSFSLFFLLMIAILMRCVRSKIGRRASH